MSFRRDAPKPIERIYAVGDIHGRFDLFGQLMRMVERDQALRLPVPTMIILLGDLVDRGPESARIVHGCMELTASTRRFMVLKGNHEEMMVEALRGDLTVYGHWLGFGGRETLLSWGVEPAIAEGPGTIENLRAAAAVVGTEVIDWLARLPLSYRHDGYFFVHAGIRPGVPLRKQTDDDMLWITDEFLDSKAWHGATVVHGHSINEGGPAIYPNRIGIDTGAYRTGRLTAVGVERGETWMLNTAPVEESTSAADGYMIKAATARDAYDLGRSI